MRTGLMNFTAVEKKNTLAGVVSYLITVVSICVSVIINNYHLLTNKRKRLNNFD